MYHIKTDISHNEVIYRCLQLFFTPFTLQFTYSLIVYPLKVTAGL